MTTNAPEPGERPLETPRGPRRDDRFELTFKRLDDRGCGLATLDLLVGPGKQPLRYIVAARDVLPGERAVVTMQSRKRRVLHSEVVQRIATSAERISPDCPHYGAPSTPGQGCGGCSLRHLSLRGQAAAKQDLVKRALRACSLDDGVVQPVRAHEATDSYRNKMEFSFGNDADRSFSLGLHPAGYRYQTLNLRSCRLMSPFVSALLPLIGDWARESGLSVYDPRRDEGLLRTLTAREGKRTGERMVVLETELGGLRPDDLPRRFQQVCEELSEQLEPLGHGGIDSVFHVERDACRGRKTRWITHHVAGTSTLREVLRLPGGRELAFAIGPRAFFQPNTLGAEAIYAEVVAQARLSAGAGLVLDLYCGTGTIGLVVAPWAQRVIGVELNEEAVANARVNAERNGIHNATFHAGDAGKVLQELALGAGSVDVAIVDPPRAGLNPEAVAQVAQLQPRRLVYVACRPESLARNAAELKAHGYALKVVQPIDQFAWTGHVECVATLERSAG